MEYITQRAIIGTFYKALAALTGAPWIAGLSNYFTSAQAIEIYAWLGQSPVLREWIGGRQAKGLTENKLTVANKHFEASLPIMLKDLRRDKTGQILIRVMEMARKTNVHWASLISTLIAGGESGLCYDGSYFFDNAHSEGKSGSQNNIVTVDISALPTSVHGSTTLPSVEEIQLCIAQAIVKILSFKDDQGEPMNEDAFQFLVMVPVSLMFVARTAVKTPVQIAASQTALEGFKDDFSISVATNPRLSAWTDKFAVFRTDSNVKAFIRQEETQVEFTSLGPDSEHAIKNKGCLYTVDTWRNAAYGYWQNACLVDMD